MYRVLQYSVFCSRLLKGWTTTRRRHRARMKSPQFNLYKQDFSECSCGGGGDASAVVSSIITRCWVLDTTPSIVGGEEFGGKFWGELGSWPSSPKCQWSSLTRVFINSINFPIIMAASFLIRILLQILWPRRPYVNGMAWHQWHSNFYYNFRLFSVYLF